MKSCILILLSLMLTTSCVDINNIVVSLKDGKLQSKSSSASVSNIKIVGNKLEITGVGLNSVTSVKLDEDGTAKIFTVESKTANKIVATGSQATTLTISKVFKLILSEANASATFPIDFSLCDATLAGIEMDCTLPADGEVLAYDAGSNKWKPTAVSGVATPVIGQNGYAKLQINLTEPVACNAGTRGSIALNSEAEMCICKSSGSWQYLATDGNESANACQWDMNCPNIGLPQGATVGNWMKCRCSAAQLASGPVVGGDSSSSDYIYSTASSICRAFIHSGFNIGPDEYVNFLITTGKASYPGTTQNGVSSSAGGATAISFSTGGAVSI